MRPIRVFEPAAKGSVIHLRASGLNEIGPLLAGLGLSNVSGRYGSSTH